MAHSTAYVTIDNYVSKYIFKKKLPQDDFFVYLQHACDCYRKINMHHSNKVMTSKVTSDTLGIIEFPSDLIGFNYLFVPINGEFWSFSKAGRKVTTTTTVDGVETQDADQGEGVNIKQNTYWGLGAKGGVNNYSINIDFSARRIFCDNFKSETAVLQYTSSGLVVDGLTYVDAQCEPVMDAYIAWQMALVNNESLGKVDRYKEIYKEELFDMRKFNFMPTKDEISDCWDASSTQSVQR